MKNKLSFYKLFLTFFLLIVGNVFSQETESNLNEVYALYRKSDPNSSKVKLIDYLVKQHHVLQRIESNSIDYLKSPSESEIEKLELMAYEFMENIGAFENNNKNISNEVSKANINQFVEIYSLLSNNFEIFRRFLNNPNKEKFEEYKANNVISKNLIVMLIKEFQK